MITSCKINRAGMGERVFCENTFYAAPGWSLRASDDSIEL
jgi:hypothetical protein